MQTIRRLCGRPSVASQGIVSRIQNTACESRSQSHQQNCRQVHIARELKTPYSTSLEANGNGSSGTTGTVSPDATEFGYRVVSPLQASVKYTATTTEPRSADHHYYPSSLSLIDDDLANGLRGRTVDTLGVVGPAPTTQLFFSSSHSETPEEIIASQEDWDSVLDCEVLKPRQEIMKEDPYLSDYESTVLTLPISHFASATANVFGSPNEGQEDAECNVDDWDAACELDY